MRPAHLVAIRLLLVASLPLFAACRTPSLSARQTPTAFAVATATPRPPDEGEKCGSERWSVKTLSDDDAGRVNFTPVDASVAELRALARPASLPRAARIAPTELTTFRVTARVVTFKVEGDSDVHLVIADPDDPAATMIVEFPDAEACSGADVSAHAVEMRAARAALEAALGVPSASRFVSIAGTVTLSGVGFFDFFHGQTGVAPNGIELHPVLGIQLDAESAIPAGAARSPANATPPPTGGRIGKRTGVVVLFDPLGPDRDCGDFRTWAQAQDFFEAAGGPAQDPHRLDADHDGIACEALPGAPR